MPPSLTETWKTREKIREMPPDVEMLNAFLEILTALRTLHPPEESEPFDIAFNDSGLLNFGGFLDTVSIPNMARFILKGERFDDASRYTAYELIPVVLFYLKEPDIKHVYSEWKFHPNDQGSFNITELTGIGESDHLTTLKTGHLIHSIELLKKVLQDDPRYRGNFPLQRAFRQFDQAVERLDQPPELVPQLMRIVEDFGGKIRGLVGALTAARQATAAAEAKAIAAQDRAEVAEARLAGIRDLIGDFEEEGLEKGTSPVADSADWRPPPDASTDDDDYWVAAEDRSFSNDLPSFRTPKPFFAKIRSRLHDSLISPWGVLYQAKYYSMRAVNFIGDIQVPLFLFSGFMVLGHCGNRCSLNSATEGRQAVQVFVREGPTLYDPVTSIHYRAPFEYSSLKKTPILLTESDIQEGGDFYYGAEAMKLLEGRLALGEEACAVVRDEEYRYSEQDEASWGRVFLNRICGPSAMGEDAVLLNANYRTFGSGMVGVNNLAWIGWGFVEGVQDADMTVGHELVSAAMMRYPWPIDNNELAYLKDEVIKEVIVHPSFRYGAGTPYNLGNNRWEIRYRSGLGSYGQTIDLNDPSWVNFQDDSWDRIKARANEALKGLIDDGKIPEKERELIMEQIEGARPRSLEDIFGNRSYVPSQEYRSASDNPGEYFGSIYDSPFDEAVVSLTSLRDEGFPRHYNYSDIEGDLASITLTIDPYIQAQIMEHPDDIRIGGSTYEEARLMVVNDAGEIVGFYDGNDYSSNNPASIRWSPNPSPGSWTFKTDYGDTDTLLQIPGKKISLCYGKDNLHNWLSLIHVTRTGKIIPRPHIIDSYWMRDPQMERRLPLVYVSDQDACPELLYAEGERYQRILEQLTPFATERHDYYIATVSHDVNPHNKRTRVHFAWTTVADGPTYTAIVAYPDPAPKQREVLVDHLIQSIHNAWAERQAAAPN